MRKTIKVLVWWIPYNYYYFCSNFFYSKNLPAWTVHTLVYTQNLPVSALFTLVSFLKKKKNLLVYCNNTLVSFGKFCKKKKLFLNEKKNWTKVTMIIWDPSSKIFVILLTFFICVAYASKKMCPPNIFNLILCESKQQSLRLFNLIESISFKFHKIEKCLFSSIVSDLSPSFGHELDKYMSFVINWVELYSS